MTFNIEAETQKIRSMRARWELIMHYDEIDKSSFLTDPEKVLLKDIIIDRYPDIIFVNEGARWTELLHQEWVCFKDAKNNPDKLSVSKNRIKGLIEKHSKLSDKDKTSILHKNYYKSYHVQDIVEISYDPELFDDYLKSIQGVCPKIKSRFYAKIFEDIVYYKTHNDDGIRHASSLFNKLELKSVPTKAMNRNPLVTTFYFDLLKEGKIELDLCIKNILNYNSTEDCYQYHAEEIRFVSDILPKLLEIPNNTLRVDNFWGVSPYGRPSYHFNYFNLFTDLVCLENSVYLTVFNQFNKLSNDEKTTILCCEADVLKEIIHEGVEPGDYYDYFKDYKIIGQCTPLKRIIAKNREAIPELIKSIETLSINNQAKIWQKETPFISKYPDEVKSGFYLFRLKEKISAFEGKQNKPAYKQAYLEANTLYEALIKDRDENKCRNWINLIETAKKETTLTQHRGMKDIFIGLLLFPYALYKLYKGTFFKEPFTRTRTTIILDELSNVTSNAA